MANKVSLAFGPDDAPENRFRDNFTITQWENGDVTFTSKSRHKTNMIVLSEREVEALKAFVIHL